MVAMNVSLTPELDGFVRAQVEGGRYRSSSEVVRDALRLFQGRLDERAAKLEWLRAEVPKGIDSRPSTHLDFADIKRRGRERSRRIKSPIGDAVRQKLNDGIDVIRVLHSARDIGAIFDRET